MLVENNITSEIADKQRQIILNTKKLAKMRGKLQRLKKKENAAEYNELNALSIKTGEITLNGMTLLFINMKELISQTMTWVSAETDSPALELHYRWLQREIERISRDARHNEQTLFEHYACITGMLFISFQYLFFFFIQILIYHHLLLSANCIHLLTIWLY